MLDDTEMKERGFRIILGLNLGICTSWLLWQLCSIRLFRDQGFLCLVFCHPYDVTSMPASTWPKMTCHHIYVPSNMIEEGKEEKYSCPSKTQ